MRSVLEGIRVLELASFHVAGHAASLLGRLGADVIKIEDPVRGDSLRGVKKTGGGIPVVGLGGRGLIFEAANLNKKGIVLDLKKRRGKELFYGLVAKSDVFVTNFRPDVLERLGADYPTLRCHNPRLIYAAASTLGSRGAESALRGNDFVGQARSGIMMAQHSPDNVPFSPLGLGDEMGCISTAYGILAALLARERFGIGQEVDTSILGGMILLQSILLTVRLLTGLEAKPIDRHRSPNPMFNVYRDKNGEWFCVAAGVESDKFWPAFCRVLGIEELEKDPKFENLDRREENSAELISILDEIFAQRSREEWLKILQADDLFASPINTYSDLLSDPQVIDNEYIVDYEHPTLGKVKLMGSAVRLSETPARIFSPAPEHGQHTEEVLMELLGLTWKDIDRLREEAVI